MWRLLVRRGCLRAHAGARGVGRAHVRVGRRDAGLDVRLDSLFTITIPSPKKSRDDVDASQMPRVDGRRGGRLGDGHGLLSLLRLLLLRRLLLLLLR